MDANRAFVMWSHRWFFFACLLIVAGLSGCSGDGLSDGLKENQPPEVWLGVAPPEGSIASYKVSITWGGWDPDGEIAYYEYAITDNESGAFDPADTTGAANWHRIYTHESTFSFSADVLADSSGLDPDDLRPVEFRRSHTFFIRSVDDRGLASRRPAYRSFTSETLSPVVDIIEPAYGGGNPARISPIAKFRCVGEDYVTTPDETQEPDSVRWILVSTVQFNDDWGTALEYIRANPGAPEWSAWSDYATDTTWTTPPLDYGPYLAAVQVMDEAGAVSPVYDETRNVRRVLVVSDLPPPVLTVYNDFLGWMRSSTYDSQPWIAEVFAGLPMSLRIWASSCCLLKLAGYRYGWDIQDLDDDSQWSPMYPFVTDDFSAQLPPRTFDFDSHTLHIEVVNEAGFETRLGIRMNIVPLTMDRDLLLVDDWVEDSPGFAETNGATPSDTEHDEFWTFVLDRVSRFDPLVDVMDVTGAADIPATVLAGYRSLIWSAPGNLGTADPPLLSKIIRPPDPRHPQTSPDELRVNTLAMYMAVGGHVMLCGETIMTNAIDTQRFPSGVPAFPLIYRYELGGDQDGDYEDSDVGERGIGEDSFAYRDACLDVLDIAYMPDARGRRRDPGEICPVGDVRDYDPQSQGLRVAIPFVQESFPSLALRPEVAGPGRRYAEDSSGLNSDIYNPRYFSDLCPSIADFLMPPRECFEPIYGLGCVDQNSVIYNAPVAYWTSVYADRVPLGCCRARSAIWGFHPVYFDPGTVKEALDLVLFAEWHLARKTH